MEFSTRTVSPLLLLTEKEATPPAVGLTGTQTTPTLWNCQKAIPSLLGITGTQAIPPPL